MDAFRPISHNSFFLLVDAGDVFERLADMTTYNEKKARDLAVQLIGAMEVLHDRKIAHRGTSAEIKPKTDKTLPSPLNSILPLISIDADAVQI